MPKSASTFNPLFIETFSHLSHSLLLLASPFNPLFIETTQVGVVPCWRSRFFQSSFHRDLVYFQPCLIREAHLSILFSSRLTGFAHYGTALTASFNPLFIETRTGDIRLGDADNTFNPLFIETACLHSRRALRGFDFQSSFHRDSRGVYRSSLLAYLLSILFSSRR